MTSQSKSKATGALKGVEEKPQLDTQLSSVAKTKSTSAMLENTATAKSQVGFQPTKPLEIDKETANAKLVVTFAAELGALVEWRKIELVDGREVFALCFPTNAWTTNTNGELVARVSA